MKIFFILFSIFFSNIAYSNQADLDRLNKVLEMSKSPPAVKSKSFPVRPISPASVDKDVVCIDNILYFVGRYRKGTSQYLTYEFVSGVKIDPRTLQPQTCD